MKAQVQVQLLTAERTKEAKEERALLEQGDLHGPRVNFCQGKLNAKSLFRGIMFLLTNCRLVNCFTNFLPGPVFPVILQLIPATQHHCSTSRYLALQAQCSAPPCSKKANGTGQAT